MESSQTFRGMPVLSAWQWLEKSRPHRQYTIPTAVINVQLFQSLTSKDLKRDKFRWKPPEGE